MHPHHADPTTGEDEMEMADAELAYEGARAGNGAAPARRTGPPPVDTVPAANRDPKDPRTWGKVGRNEACPCGSGKKFKHCHGRFG